MILIVASRKDIASINVRQQLLANYDFREEARKFHNNTTYHTIVGPYDVKLVTIKECAIHYQNITDHFHPKIIIYISRHSSKSGIPTLSVHTPGNLTQVQKGGRSRKISIAPANAMREALWEMVRQKRRLGLDYQVSYECTHHGPSLNVPAMFVELGSSPTQWEDIKAAEALAHSIMALISKRPRYSRVAVGIGGPHYSSKFTRMALDDSFAFGHLIPKYAVSEVDAEIIKQCVERTLEKVEVVVLDWKGIRGGDKSRVSFILEKIGVKIQKV
ncbi:MAG: hypothetical protein JSV51_02360 [Candidatus Bathyarchaeota archaeon]|nr:MAG: hypothetical protein JSV51_02360 [Candidatus Bathyarchaeota archaeon]